MDSEVLQGLGWRSLERELQESGGWEDERPVDEVVRQIGGLGCGHFSRRRRFRDCVRYGVTSCRRRDPAAPALEGIGRELDRSPRVAALESAPVDCEAPPTEGGYALSQLLPFGPVRVQRRNLDVWLSGQIRWRAARQDGPRPHLDVDVARILSQRLNRPLETRRRGRLSDRVLSEDAGIEAGPEAGKQAEPRDAQRLSPRTGPRAAGFPAGLPALSRTHRSLVERRVGCGRARRGAP